MNCKHKFQTKYEAKIKLIRCYSKQVTFLRYYCKKWKVFTVQNYESMSIKLSGKTIIIREDFIYFIRESILLYIKRKKIQMGKWNCYRQGCIFRWSRPVKLDPPLVRTSHVYKCIVCVFNTQTLSIILWYYATHGKKSTIHSIRIFGIKCLNHIFIYIFWSILPINRFQQTW